MPSPLAHASAGYLIYRLTKRWLTASASPRLVRALALLAVLFLALLPDADAFPGLFVGNLSQYHNNRTHSLLVGLAVTAGVGLALKALRTGRAAVWALTALLCYELHVAMDYVTRGSRGIMALWPVTDQRFGPPSLCVFTGLHYAKGLFSVDHLWTFLNELAFTLVVLAVVYLVDRHTKTPEQTPGNG
jgi:hypothetical protein